MIRIVKSNVPKLVDALDDSQSRARVRTLDVSDLFDFVEEAEKSNPVLAILPKKSHTGVTLVACKGDTFPGTYKGTPQTTWVVFKRRASGWFFERAYRDTCPCGDRLLVTCPKTVLDEALKRFASSVEVADSSG